MTYTMVKKNEFRFPTERYLNIVKKGYKASALPGTVAGLLDAHKNFGKIFAIDLDRVFIIFG